MGILDRFRSWFASPSVADGERAQLLAATSEAARLGDELARSVGGFTLPRRGSAELLAAYGTTPWLHATVRRRAEALAAVEWVLFKPGATGVDGPTRRLRGLGSRADIRHRALEHHERQKRLVQVTDHPLLDLLEHPCEGMPGATFWELISKWLDLVGEAPQAVTFDGDDVVEMTPIVPTWLTKVASTERPWFEVCPPGRSKPIRVPEEDMLWVRQHDVEDPWRGRGIGTAHVLSDELETDEYMASTAKARFYNRGHPDFFVGLIPPGSSPTSTNADAVKALSAAVEAKHRGVHKAGRIHIVGQDVRVAPLAGTMADNQFVDGRKFLRDTCMQVFGTPPEILGVLSSSNRSTIDAADFLFAKFSTLPMLERLRAFYQAQLVPLFGDDLFLDFVSPVPADKAFQKDVMVALPAAFRINEVRHLAGVDPVADGDKPYPAAKGNVPVAGTPKKEPADAADA